MEQTLIRFPEVRRMVGGVSESTIRNWVSERGFPRQGNLGGRVAVWNRRDVQRWIDRNLARQADEKSRFVAGPSTKQLPQRLTACG